MNFLQGFLSQLRQIYAGMSAGRRVGLGLAAVLVLAGFLAVGYSSWQADYRVLFSGLSPEEAGAVTNRLSTLGIPYRLAAGGTTILAPTEQVQQARVNLAVEGLPSRGGKGFELFDESSLGMTPFVQNVNYGRALQAELAKSIMQIEPVASARVHIVRPEPTPFVREQKPTTASVVLKLRPGAVLSRGVAAGIVALVSRGVEGLAPENVTLVDSTGRVLSEQRGPDSDLIPATQLEYRRELEAYLSSRAEEMLAKTVGLGRAIVRVTADINFKRVKEKRETYSPEDKVVASEKVTTSKANNGSGGARGVVGASANLGRGSGAAGGGGGNSQEETTQTDYLVSKSVRELEDKMGTIERLTVAAMLDLSPGDETRPIPGITLADAQDIIKQAVGFKTGRDDIKVSSVRLASLEPPPGEPNEEAANLRRIQAYVVMARNISLGLSALLALLLGFLLLRRLRPAPKAAGGEAAAGATPASPSPPAPNEDLNRFIELARRDPALVARSLSNMMNGLTAVA